MQSSPYPDFYIIGAAKAGTTSLVDMLRQHDSVFFSHEKEPHHFFLRQDNRDWRIHDYDRTHSIKEIFPYIEDGAYRGLYRDAPENSLCGDASTQYLVNATVPAAIHDVRRDARIIAVLRHPTDRAYSAFLHARSRGEEPEEEFSKALDRCEAGERETAFAINYIAEGEYDRHLEHWQDLFGDRLLVILFEDLVEAPRAVIDRVTTFLGISPLGVAEESASHKNASVEIRNPVAQIFRRVAKRLRRAAPSVFESALFRRPYEAILPLLGRKPEGIAEADRKGLDRHFAPHIAATEALIGRDLSKWRSR